MAPVIRATRPRRHHRTQPFWSRGPPEQSCVDPPFFKQSDRVGNAALIYEKYGVTGQVAVSHTSPNLGTLGAAADADNHADRYTAEDVRGSVPVGRRLKAFLEWRNLNDEARRRYAGIPARRTSHELYSWTMNAGIDWRF